MSSTTKSAATVIGTGIVFFAIADVVASFLSWHGAPTDTTWEPSFWKYEVWRLSYWFTFTFVAAMFTFAVACMISWYRRAGHHFPGTRVTVAVLFSISAFGTEYSTSIRFWQSLPNDDAVALWFSERLYIRDHLGSWLFAVAALLLALFYCRWMASRKRAHVQGT